MRDDNSAPAPFAIPWRALLYDSFAWERPIMRNGIIVCLFFCTAILATPMRATCQFSPAPISATTIPADHLVQVADVVRTLRSGESRPAILQVGSRIFFDEAHISGALYAGPGSQPAGLELLERIAASEPKDALIVLYCGCCPWGRCPNVGPAFRRLSELGYTNVKVLYLPNNFGDDWVAKGYPTDRK